MKHTLLESIQFLQKIVCVCCSLHLFRLDFKLTYRSFPYRLFDRHQIDPNQCTEYRNPRGCHSNNLLAHSTLRRFHQRFHGSTNHVPRKRCLKKKNKGDFTIIHTLANTTFLFKIFFSRYPRPIQARNFIFQKILDRKRDFFSSAHFCQVRIYPKCTFSQVRIVS